ncbi:hypothetical protein PRIPAC_84808 [Pristionchus pacificus]|uniref:Uncharacterized protein n=1 Tax=Pristionchus pacificus TaxID=54126 RepID=A0A2A6BNR3_PRIPA|nr:hypothetical protein PRIPAC_84808 [Pristionchus pacificus]|eukprot:PDM67602.1 hypothetical protein PRIPAC_49019 [Pristionchus pacificus]
MRGREESEKIEVIGYWFDIPNTHHRATVALAAAKPPAAATVPAAAAHPSDFHQPAPEQNSIIRETEKTAPTVRSINQITKAQ